MSAEFADSIQTILVTRLDSLGDIILGTLLLQGLHRRWPTARVRLLVRPQMMGVAAILPDWVEVHALPFDPRQPVAGHEARIADQLKATAESLRSDLVIVAEYNRVWAGEIVARLCGAETIVAFDGPTGINIHHRSIVAALEVDLSGPIETVPADEDEREPLKYLAMLRAMEIETDALWPRIRVREEDRAEAKELWANCGVEPSHTIVCFPSGADLLVRSLDAAVWVRWIEHLGHIGPVVLLGSEWDIAVLDEIAAAGLSDGVKRIVLPAEKIGVMAGFLEPCKAYVGMDTGPMHAAAALGRPTLGVFGGGLRAHRFLPVGQLTAAIRMPLGCYGCDWHCPFDRRHCIKDMPEQSLLDAGDAFFSNLGENPDPMSLRIFDLPVPPHLPVVLLGPMMRQHRTFLESNHRTLEHLTFVNEQLTNAHGQLASLNHSLAGLSAENHLRARAIEQLVATATDMTNHNQTRDEAITHIHEIFAEMTVHNCERDKALADIANTFAEMTRQNQARDQAIADINQRLSESITNHRFAWLARIGQSRASLK